MAQGNIDLAKDMLTARQHTLRADLKALCFKPSSRCKQLQDDQEGRPGRGEVVRYSGRSRRPERTAAWERSAATCTDRQTYRQKPKAPSVRMPRAFEIGCPVHASYILWTLSNHPCLVHPIYPSMYPCIPVWIIEKVFDIASVVLLGGLQVW